MNTFSRQCSAAAEAQPTLATRNKNGKTLKIWEPAFLMKVTSSTAIGSPPPSQNDSLLKTESRLQLETLSNRQRENLFLCLSMCKGCRKIQTWLRRQCYQTRKNFSQDKAPHFTEPSQLESTRAGSTAQQGPMSAPVWRSTPAHGCLMLFKAHSQLQHFPKQDLGTRSVAALGQLS